MEKLLSDLRWMPLAGSFEAKDGNELVYTGGEYDPPSLPVPPATPVQGSATVADSPGRPKYVNFGTLVFNQAFTEGSIKCQVEFDEVDYRSSANIIIQYDLPTEEMLTFGIGGGGVTPQKGTGFLFGLRRWANRPDPIESQQGSPGNASPPKSWTNFAQGGEGKNLKPHHPYDLEVTVQGSIVTAYVDSVEVIRHNLAVPVLPGRQFGIFCGSHSTIRFRNISDEAVEPKAFVVMQFNVPEYEALFRDVIEPICRAEGLQAYRGDSTYLPGLVVADIKKQIAESRVVIAEITPANAMSTTRSAMQTL